MCEFCDAKISIGHAPVNVGPPSIEQKIGFWVVILMIVCLFFGLLL